MFMLKKVKVFFKKLLLSRQDKQKEKTKRPIMGQGCHIQFGQKSDHEREEKKRVFP